MTCLMISRRSENGQYSVVFRDKRPCFRGKTSCAFCFFLRDNPLPGVAPTFSPGESLSLSRDRISPRGESLSRACNKVSPRGKVSRARATRFPPGGKSLARVQQGFPPGESLLHARDKVSPRGKVPRGRASALPPNETIFTINSYFIFNNQLNPKLCTQ
jgi:hypothetical protein